MRHRLGPMPSAVISLDWSANGAFIRATSSSQTISCWDVRPTTCSSAGGCAYTVAFLDEISRSSTADCAPSDGFFGVCARPCAETDVIARRITKQSCGPVSVGSIVTVQPPFEHPLGRRATAFAAASEAAPRCEVKASLPRRHAGLAPQPPRQSRPRGHRVMQCLPRAAELA